MYRRKSQAALVLAAEVGRVDLQDEPRVSPAQRRVENICAVKPSFARVEKEKHAFLAEKAKDIKVSLLQAREERVSGYCGKQYRERLLRPISLRVSSMTIASHQILFFRSVCTFGVCVLVLRSVCIQAANLGYGASQLPRVVQVNLRAEHVRKKKFRI